MSNVQLQFGSTDDGRKLAIAFEVRGEGIAAKYAAKTTCKVGHELEPVPGYERRFCRECARAAGKRFYEKNREKISRARSLKRRLRMEAGNG